MKKIFTVLLFCALSLNIFAQWKSGYAKEVYTEEEYPIIYYINDSSPIPFGIKYIDSTLEVQIRYMPFENFDLWWYISSEHNGHYKYISDIDLNFIGKAAVEYNIRDYIYTAERNELYFGFSIDDADKEILKALKANNRLKIRFYNIVEEKITVLNIPLSGVTLCCKKVGL